MKKHSSKYKDTVFRKLFSDQDKLRTLYNALTKSSYGKETPVSINTLKNTLTQSLINDISFTIGEKTVVFMEHQSTLNPGLPFRIFLYAAAIYEKIVSKDKFYGIQNLKIPDPEFYLFYNGTSPFPEMIELKLSESFERSQRKKKIFLELLVDAYNINAGHNRELFEKSKDLKEYAQFVALVREKQVALKSKEDKEEAFQLAIKECIEHNILKDFFEEHGEETMNKNSILNITDEEYIEIRERAARKNGLEEGRKEAEKETQKKIQQEKLESARKMKEAGLPINQIKTFTGLSPGVIKKL